MMDGMKVVSRRAAGSNPLDDAARLQRTLRGLRGGLVRRGVYRFSSFEEADAWMMSQIASTAARPNLKNLLTSKWVEVSEPAQLARCLQPICHRVTTID